MVDYVTFTINEHLETPVDPLDIEVNFLSTFPNVGLTINNAVFSDTLDGKIYPLMKIGKVQLVFGLKELFSGKAIVHKITISDGFYHEFKDPNGVRHKLRIKPKNPSPEKIEKPSTFYLPVIELNNIRIFSESFYLGNAIELVVDQGFGDFKIDRLGILHLSNAHGNLKRFKSGFIDLVQDAPFRVSGTLIINGKNKLVSFETSSGICAGLEIKLDGYVKNVNDTSKYQKIHIAGFKNDSKFLSAFLPGVLKNDSLSTDSSSTTISLISEGLKSPANQPRTQVTFNLKNGRVQNPETLDGFSDIDLKGEILTNDPHYDKAQLKLTGGMKGHFKTLDLFNPKPEYSALFRRYSLPGAVTDTMQKKKKEIPDQVKLNVTCDIEKLVYKAATVSGVSFNASVEDQQVIVESLKGTGFGGSFNLNATLGNRVAGGFDLFLDARFSRIEMRELLSQFGNFNQDYIQASNLKGKTSLTISGKTRLTNTLEPVLPKTTFKAKATIDEAELINWPLLVNALSKVNMKDQAERILLSKSEISFALNKNVFYVAPVEIATSLTKFDVSATAEINKRLDLIIKLNVADQLLTSKKTRRQEVRTGQQLSKERKWGFVYLYINGSPKNLQVEVLKKETFELIRRQHKKGYLSVSQN